MNFLRISCVIMDLSCIIFIHLILLCIEKSAVFCIMYNLYALYMGIHE